MRARLARQGFAAGTIERTVEKLRSLNYVNDDDFARGWARERAENRGYGPRRIDQELKQKGIAASLIKEVLAETFRRGDEAERARAVITKRFRGKDLKDPKILRRAAAFLRRRGYGGAVVVDLLRRHSEHDLIEDE